MKAAAERILIVDDEPVNLKVLEKLLRSQGFNNLELIADSREVIGRYQNTRPDLILLDLNMPHLDGYQVIEQLKQLNDPLLSPIIILTAQHSRDSLIRGLSAGARDYITKPFDRNELLMRVRNLLDVHLAHRMMSDQKAVLEELVEERTEQLQQMIKEMEYRVTHDLLTGLVNRTLLMERLEEALSQPLDAGRMVAMMLVDLDRFKIINDSLGHDLGDEILCAVAQRLSGALGDIHTVARFSGDVFAILVSEMTDIESVRQVAAEVLRVISEPILVRGREITLTASLGLSLAPQDGNDAVTLVRNADIALSQAKDRRDHFAFFNEEMNRGLLITLELESALRQALERGEFELFYQPKVDLGSGCVNGCEALIRWRNPERGLVSPADFIPLAEETGLIVPIGTWALKEACRQGQAWQAEGLAKITIAVNLSARQFRQGDLAWTVSSILSASGFDPGLLELELTESMIMDDPGEAEESLHELKRLGVKLSLDDFGTGYSSLNYLRRFPVDCLKIDRFFIRDMSVDDTGASVVTSIIQIAHNLNLTAVAEGVETREQLQFLVDNECDSLQGFYFSKPLPAAEFAQLLREERSLTDEIVRERC